MTISFFLRGNMIQARISDKDKCLRISTGMKVGRNQKFDGEFIGNSLEVAGLNNELLRHKILLTELFLKYGNLEQIKANYKITPELQEDNTESFEVHELLNKYVNQMSTGEILTRNNKRFSPISVSTYAQAANMMANFSSEHGPLDISKFHVDATASILQKKDISTRFALWFKAYENWMIDHNYSIKSRCEAMNMANIMISYFSRAYFFNIPKIPRLANIKKPKVVFPPEFVGQFVMDKHNIYKGLNETMKMVWEVSATILITTLRVSDAISLTEKDLIFRGNDVLLNKRNEKTGEISQMPLPKSLTDVYRENLTRKGGLFSVKPTKQILYDNMKDLFKMYDDLHDYYSIHKLGIRGEQIVESKPLYQWAHPHLLRKTAITTMIYMGVDQNHIKHTSGHSPNSEAFYDYVHVVDKLYKSDFKNAHEKMGLA